MIILFFIIYLLAVVSSLYNSKQYFYNYPTYTDLIIIIAYIIIIGWLAFIFLTISYFIVFICYPTFDALPWMLEKLKRED